MNAIAPAPLEEPPEFFPRETTSGLEARNATVPLGKVFLGFYSSGLFVAIHELEVPIRTIENSFSEWRRFVLNLRGGALLCGVRTTEFTAAGLERRKLNETSEHAFISTFETNTCDWVTPGE